MVLWELYTSWPGLEGSMACAHTHVHVHTCAHKRAHADMHAHCRDHKKEKQLNVIKFQKENRILSEMKKNKQQYSFICQFLGRTAFLENEGQC